MYLQLINKPIATKKFQQKCYTIILLFIFSIFKNKKKYTKKYKSRLVNTFHDDVFNNETQGIINKIIFQYFVIQNL